MANVILLIENNYEDMEALYPFYRMQEAGHKVAVVGPAPGTYSSKHGYPLKADKAPKDIDLKKFRALIIPGGGAPDRMRINRDMVRLVREADEKSLVIGAICHGPQMLIEADLLRGRRSTCYVSVKTDLVNAGGVYLDEPAVVDGNLVTSRHPGDLPDFCRGILGLMG